MPWVSLCTLRTKSSCPGPGMSSKKTTAILRPTASPSYILSSLPPRVLLEAMYKSLSPAMLTRYMNPGLKTDFT